MLREDNHVDKSVRVVRNLLHSLTESRLSSLAVEESGRGSELVNNLLEWCSRCSKSLLYLVPLRERLVHACNVIGLLILLCSDWSIPVPALWWWRLCPSPASPSDPSWWGVGLYKTCMTMTIYWRLKSTESSENDLYVNFLTLTCLDLTLTFDLYFRLTLY